MTKKTRTSLLQEAVARVGAEGLAAALTTDQRLALRFEWRAWARSEQVPPEDGDWRVFLYLAGRGAGKTRSAAEWTRRMAKEHPGCRLGIVGRTAGDVRDTCVEGESGLLACSPPWFRPEYEPSKRRLTWPNGSRATTFSADQPDELRGPQFHFAWADELAAWQYPDESWAMLMLALRLGERPRAFVSTTPRPLKLIRDLLQSPTTVTRRGSTYDNAANLSPLALREFTERYGSTRLGRQELFAELLWDTPGALWNLELLDRTRVREAPADLRRIVIGIDPATSAGEGSDLTGIIAAGRDERGHICVLRDASLRASPDGWARRAVALFDELQADRIVVEKNAGGDMCEATLRTVRRDLPITMVHASRGKVTRAEPVAALWEQGKAHIVGSLPELEEEMCSFAPGAMEHSPDRADAMIWACTDLMKGASGASRTRAIVGTAPPTTRSALPSEVQEAAIGAARAQAVLNGDPGPLEPVGAVRATPPAWRGGPSTWYVE